MQIFDAHFHVIDDRYPLIENNGYLPPVFTVNDYEEQTKELNIVGGVIVSGSFQGFDQTYLMDSLGKLGENYFGVANIPYDMSDENLEALKKANVVAVRFNLKRGGSATIDHLEYLSNKLFDQFGWHTELYVENKYLKELKPILEKLNQFSIDHLGLSKDGLADLYYWVEKGVKVKATGFGRIEFPPLDVLRQINQINPNALMFGTDLPSTRAKNPFSKKDIDLIKEHFDEKSQKRIFHQNAQEWYSR